MNIYQKLLAITSEIKNVSKNLEVGIGKSSYKAVGEADVLSAVKKLEAEHGVYSYPSSRRVIDREVLETEKTYNGNTTKGNQIFLRVETIYRFVNVENPDEFIEITTYGDGVDTQDKAPGKAMTYADKYALLKAYKIITGEDPDQEHSPDTARYTGPKNDTPRPPTEYIPKNATTRPVGENYRKKVIRMYEEQGIDPREIPKMYNVDSSTTPERWEEIYHMVAASFGKEA